MKIENDVVVYDDSIEIGKLNFAVPTICSFKSEGEEPNDDPSYGIAYHKEIICLCCGAAMPLDEIVFMAYNTDDAWSDIAVFD